MSTIIKYLTEADAIKRHALFNLAEITPSYKLSLKLSKGESFSGEVEIKFSLKETSNLFLDFRGTSLTALSINAYKMENPQQYFATPKINLAQEKLQQGMNIVLVQFEAQYGNDGTGLHSFVDGEDNNQYLYSHSQPFYLNKIFPCFDQPDIKAEWAIRMIIPKDWVGISNQNVETEVDLTETKEVVFKTTQVISSYLVEIAAGPYECVEAKEDQLYKGIPMAAYCRKSLAKLMKEQANEFFYITAQGMKFYEKFFNYPYSFHRYVYIFCPEFIWGAMEHPGAVTFGDFTIFREEPIKERKTFRAYLMLHELAHQWFGNLVTMKWWNDLWLNESFADIVCHTAFSEIFNEIPWKDQYIDPWVRFNGYKQWGYQDDKVPGMTHPINGEVINTEIAETIFDGITYAKGASALKQLIGHVGRDCFCEAMSNYFKKYEWKNATLNDFLDNMKEHYKDGGSKIDLFEWKDQWLSTSGYNFFQVQWAQSSDSKSVKLEISQDFVLPEHPVYRFHRFDVGFFYEDGTKESVNILVPNKPSFIFTTEDPRIVGKEIKAVLLNSNDESFLKVRIDQVSLDFLIQQLPKIDDLLTKVLFWRSYYGMVEDGLLSSYNFVSVASQAIEYEKDDAALRIILFLCDNACYQTAPKPFRDNVLCPMVYRAIKKQLLKTDQSQSNRLVLLKNDAIAFSSYGHIKGIDTFSDIVKWILNPATSDFSGLSLTPGLKWFAFRKCIDYPVFREDDKWALFQVIKTSDKNGGLMEQRQLRAAVSFGDNRKKIWESFIDPNEKTSKDQLAASMIGYMKKIGRDTEKEDDEFYECMVKVFETRSREYAVKFFEELHPFLDDLNKYEKKLKELKDKIPSDSWLTKYVNEKLFEIGKKRVTYNVATKDVMKHLLGIDA